jgi:RNA recognition motif-containing protein
MPTKLYVGNIPASVSSTELKELFEKYGKVLECDIIKDYAFVVSIFFSLINDFLNEPFFFSTWKMRVKRKHRLLL